MPAMLASLERSLPACGDFGMRLPAAEMSLGSITGFDRDSKLSVLKNICVGDVIEYRAVQTYIAKEAGELSFTRNERIEVLNKESSGWWFGTNEQGAQGYFPSVLVGERPANAPLPVDSNHKDSFRPKLTPGGTGTWKSAPSVDLHDERVALIQSHPEGTFVGVIHFPLFTEDICLETNDVVDVVKLGSDSGQVIVRNDRNQTGSVPLNIMTVKFKANENTIRN